MRQRSHISGMLVLCALLLMSSDALAKSRDKDFLSCCFCAGEVSRGDQRFASGSPEIQALRAFVRMP